MNNKFLKRVAAVVLGAVVISTCAFASTVTDAGYSDLSLSYEISNDSGADKISYIAYAGADEATAETIVAVNQIDNAGSTASDTVSISSNLLGDSKVIVFMTGDSKGSAVDKEVVFVQDYVAATTQKNAGTNTVEFNNFTYTNVPVFDVDVTVYNGVYKITGLKAEGRDGVWAIPEITGTGTLSVKNVYVLGAPEDVVAAGIKLSPVLVKAE